MILKSIPTNKRLPDHYKKGIYPGFLEALKQQKRLEFEECNKLTYEFLFNLANFSLSEVRVLSYIWLRTIGFRKKFEVIEYNQFIEGSYNLDKGCGLRSKSKISKTVRTLVDRKIINVQKKVGRNKFIYSINFDTLKELNARYAQKCVEFKRGKAINDQTAHRLLKQFLEANLGDIRSVDLKLWLFSYGSSQLWGELSLNCYREAYLQGYRNKGGLVYMLPCGVSRNSLYKGLERLDEQGYFELLVTGHLDHSQITCMPEDWYVANGLRFRDYREKNRVRPINYRQYRHHKRKRKEFLFNSKLTFVKSKECEMSENELAALAFHERMLNSRSGTR